MIKCLVCKRQIPEGDKAYEIEVQRIHVEGEKATFKPVTGYICVPCAEEEEEE